MNATAIDQPSLDSDPDPAVDADLPHSHFRFHGPALDPGPTLKSDFCIASRSDCSHAIDPNFSLTLTPLGVRRRRAVCGGGAPGAGRRLRCLCSDFAPYKCLFSSYIDLSRSPDALICRLCIICPLLIPRNDDAQLVKWHDLNEHFEAASRRTASVSDEKENYTYERTVRYVAGTCAGATIDLFTRFHSPRDSELLHHVYRPTLMPVIIPITVLFSMSGFAVRSLQPLASQLSH
ncbi:hypothetical protein EVAR_64105_1 [Eumeta japonica]|uniref:Uncharacterized protein n=1 Tax=Eumeta variegata TaxID=151549 RepID=A0A4C1ZEL0_EUMVA|nr:hypothetical protein EVAR_64105_1 [Eumeta japonica]